MRHWIYRVLGIDIYFDSGCMFIGIWHSTTILISKYCLLWFHDSCDTDYITLVVPRALRFW